MSMKTDLKAKFKIGNLDRSVTFRQPSESQSTASGHPTTTFADAFTELAKIEYGGGTSETYEADRQQSTTRVAFICRAHTNTKTVTAKWRLLYDGNEHDIEGVVEVGRNRFLKFNCKLRQ